MNSAHKLFVVIFAFCIILSVYYLSITSREVIIDSKSSGSDSRPTGNAVLTDKERELLEKRYWHEKSQAEKIRLETKIVEDYDVREPLEVSYITHTFYENGNITTPIKKPYLFLHLAKTAGSTLSAVFKRSERPTKFTHTWAQPKMQDMPEVVLKDSVFGHFRYGLHYYFDRPCTYMTVLREPIDRVVSHYYYHLQHKKDPGHEFAKNRTFEQWIRDSPAANNEQTRQVSGLRSQFNITEKIFDIASYHLRQMAVVGLTENYHETLFLLKYIAGLKITRYRAVNKGVRRPKLADVPPETVELIKKHNWADIELYKLGKEIFEKQIEQMPDSFFDDLEAFKKLMSKKKQNTAMLETKKQRLPPFNEPK